MIHLGDITKIDGSKIEPVHCVTFGSPCQGLSAAGKRAGLKDDRSGLFIQAIRIIKEMRAATNGSYPTFVVWENVPGSFSSNKGQDFRTVLEELSRLAGEQNSIPMPAKGKWAKSGCISGNGYSIAWRLHDAKYWGVPQRRKRVAVVMDITGQRAAEILFERTGVSGDFDKSIEPWQGIARPIENSIVGHDRVVETSGSNTIGFDGYNQALTGGVAKSLTSRSTDSDHIPLALCPNNTKAMAYGFDQGATRDVGVLFLEETSKTLANGTCPGHHTAVATAVFENHSQDSRYKELPTVCETVSAKYGTGGNNTPLVCKKVLRWIVRRLTPVECARLQGFPDDWCDIEPTVVNGKTVKYSDSAAYKAYGNSIALPFWWWLTCKTADYLPENATLGSLFDGIGGFPLVWETKHGKGTARWASEIEPFPIAVTMKNFKD